MMLKGGSKTCCGAGMSFPQLNSSFRDGALAPDPESRDSGFDASHRPGMTIVHYLVSPAITSSSPLPRSHIPEQKSCHLAHLDFLAAFGDAIAAVVAVDVFERLVA